MTKYTKSANKKHQKLYKMKGCSKSRRSYLGGKHLTNSASISLAYPSENVPKVNNPALAYTGGDNSRLEYPAAYPAKGPDPAGFNFLNIQTQQGGNCNGTCSINPMKGGGCGGNCLTNGGIPYPDGLVGKPWTPAIGGWPGVDGVSGSRNYININSYDNDITRQIQNVGASAPFLGGGKRHTRKSHKKYRNNKHKKSGKMNKASKRSKNSKKGGGLSNFLAQDLINLGRQVNYGIGSAYNGIKGVQAPVNPLPWKDQLPNTPNLNTLKLV